jgi:transketolase
LKKNILCRGTPNLQFIRPGDANECSGAWALALNAKHTPSVFALSRGNVANLPGTSIEGTLQGAYTIYEK